MWFGFSLQPSYPVMLDPCRVVWFVCKSVWLSQSGPTRQETPRQANRPPTAILQSKFDAALFDVSACGGFALDIGLAPDMMLRGSRLLTELIAARDLTNIVERGTQPNQQSHSDDYLEKCLPKHEVGHSFDLFSHGLLCHQILFLAALRGLIVLLTSSCVILRAAVRRSPLFDWFPLDFAGWALPTDAREGCSGFGGALLSMEDCWQQDHYGCDQGGSNKSDGPAKKQSSSFVPRQCAIQ
jgi:hypothetical protein